MQFALSNKTCRCFAGRYGLLYQLVDSTNELGWRCAPPLEYWDVNNENIVHSLPKPSVKRRRASATMQPYEGDTEVTPRPLKRRYLQTDTDPPEQFSPRQPPSDASSELESHHSGRLSPTKQLAALEDRDEAPIHFCDFGSTKAAIPDDVQELRAKIQLLADGVGILGYQVGRPNTCACLSNS